MQKEENTKQTELPNKFRLFRYFRLFRILFSTMRLRSMVPRLRMSSPVFEC